MQKKFSAEQARDIVYDFDDYYRVVKEEIIDTSRWSVHHECIVEESETGKLYRFFYSRGATEHQDERPFEDEKEVTADEVEAVEKRVTVYEEV